MHPTYRAVTALLIAVLLAVASNGLIGTAVPLAAHAANWSDRVLGLLGSAYFGGMLAGAVFSPAVIARVGHDRAFTAVVAIVTIATIGFALGRDPALWVVLRALIGFSMAVLYAAVESWLQGVSENSMRGRVLALYSIVQFIGLAAGNQVVALGEPGGFAQFAMAAIISSAAIVPIAVSSKAPPERPTSPSLPLKLLWTTSPLGLVGVFLIGCAGGPVWTLTPVYAAGIGLDTASVTFFMTMLMIGAASLQFPIGRLSDRYNRRHVLLGLIGATTVVELALGVLGARLPEIAIYGLSFLLGSVLATQYYVLIAHVNDRTGRANAVGIAALLLLSYCVGAMVGPLTAAEAMTRFGPTALMFHNALVHMAFAGYILWRMLRKAAPAARLETPHDVRNT